MKLKVLIYILVSIIFTNCGFKVVNQDFFKNYKFSELNITGDNKVIYLIKNKLNIDNKDSTKEIKLNIDTKKNKVVKERNIQNEITKYEITINAKIKYIIEDENIAEEFSLTKKGDFNVKSKHSETLNTEKKLTKNLINNLSEQILKNIMIRLDDL